MIPATAQSLTFIGVLGGSFEVTFNGQPLNYFETGSAANYNTYAANISAYAGQTGQLSFTAPVQNTALLDDIQFSTSAAPEPSAVAFCALGGLSLACRRWKKSSPS